LEAFDAIHALGVRHFDIRPENILVDKEGDGVWIIDFEFSVIIEDGDSEKQATLATERDLVKQILMEVKTKKA